MGNPIFWRLLLGNAGILFLSLLPCLYSIVQLGTLGNRARIALDNDQRMIGYQEALTDAFLSEVRYGGKYIFTHAEDRHQQADEFKIDFARYLRELKSLTDSEPIVNSLSKIELFHTQYHELFDREVAYIRAKQTYAQSRYQQERDKVLESMMSELERFKTLLQLNMHDRLESMDHAARTSRRITIAATLIVALLGTWFSLRMSQYLAAQPNEPQPSKQPDFLISANRCFKRLALFASNYLAPLRRRLTPSNGATARKGAIKR